MNECINVGKKQKEIETETTERWKKATGILEGNFWRLNVYSTVCWVSSWIFLLTLFVSLALLFELTLPIRSSPFNCLIPETWNFHIENCAARMYTCAIAAWFDFLYLCFAHSLSKFPLFSLFLTLVLVFRLFLLPEYFVCLCNRAIGNKWHNDYL